MKLCPLPLHVQMVMAGVDTSHSSTTFLTILTAVVHRKNSWALTQAHIKWSAFPL